MFETLILILDSTVRLSTPLLLACLAGLYSERSGVVDIGLEGKMLGAAFGAGAVGYITGSAWLGLLAGIGVACVLALIHGFASITNRGNQIVSGVAINFLAIGLTGLLGQTWFQHHPDHMPEDEQTTDITAPDEDEEVAPPPPPPLPPKPEPERKQLDPAVADILRQEAEAEQAARRGLQPQGLETQPDLGLDHDPETLEDDADRRAREARERMSRMRGEETDEALHDAAAIGSRRDLLPDIEEINSTLRAASGRCDGTSVDPEIEAPTRQRKRRGFRTGFLTVMLIFIVLATVYIVAPRLAAAVPALEAPLAAYVGLVNDARIWLNDLVRGLMAPTDPMQADPVPTNPVPTEPAPTDG